MKTNIGLPDKSTDKIAAILYQLLADETALTFLTRDAHWNVTGPLFHPLHEMFGTQYDALDGQLDEIAERIRAIGRPLNGRLSAISKQASLKEGKSTSDASKLIEILLEGHESIIRGLRKSVDETAKLGDNGTSDFLTGLMEAHEKTAWMLRSSL